jgi:3-methyladenine DNA glycosylase/8-oxoguanine DNA glycosylase
MQYSKIYDNYNQDKKEFHMTCEYAAQGKPFRGYAGLHGWSLYHFAEL